MRVTFQHPPVPINPKTGKLDPFKDFQPKNPAHYPHSSQNGIYIWGLKMKFGDVQKFVPIYVGIGELYKRLYDTHRCITPKWYFFDYEAVNCIDTLKILYRSIDKAQRYEFLKVSERI